MPGAAADWAVGPCRSARLPQVYWLSCLKVDGQYRLQCEQLFERIEMRRSQRASVLSRVMTAYALRLEQACHAAPYAWFNFYPFWAAPAARSR